MEETTGITTQTYNNCADAYEAKFSDYADYREMMARFVSGYLKAGASVLDLGCGPGIHAEFLMDAGAGSLFGVDLSVEMVERARARVPLGRFEVGDMRGLSFFETFDVVVAAFCIVHLAGDEVKALLSRIGEWLNPGGSLFLSFMTGKEDGFETTSFSSGESIHFCYHDKAFVQSHLMAFGLEVVEEHGQAYPEPDGSLTTDCFLFCRKTL